jgi:hypothetical protein
MRPLKVQVTRVSTPDSLLDIYAVQSAHAPGQDYYQYNSLYCDPISATRVANVLGAPNGSLLTKGSDWLHVGIAS